MNHAIGWVCSSANKNQCKQSNRRERDESPECPLYEPAPILAPSLAQKPQCSPEIVRRQQFFLRESLDGDLISFVRLVVYQRLVKEGDQAYCVRQFQFFVARKTPGRWQRRPGDLFLPIGSIKKHGKPQLLTNLRIGDAYSPASAMQSRAFAPEDAASIAVRVIRKERRQRPVSRGEFLPHSVRKDLVFRTYARS